MKAIIFGVTGQDGSHLSELLLEKGYEVIGVARRCSNSNSQRLVTSIKHKKFELLTGDITDTFSVKDILSSNGDVDEVYNLAAQSHVFVSFKQPTLTWDITAKGCLNILQSIVDLNLKTKFYQASSSEMFGKNYDESYDEYNAPTIKYQDEDTKFMPQSPYAIAKVAAHHTTRLYREAYGVHASCGILFNHEGPRRGEAFVTRKITKWIGSFVNACKKYDIEINSLKDSNITDSLSYDNFTFPKLRLGNLEAFRDWGYAGDYVEAMWLMLQQETPDDYVICTGETHTIREFLDVAFSHVGINDWSKYVTIDPKFYRPAEVDYLCGSNAKAKQKLNWTPKYSFEQLVKLMVNCDIHENL